MRRKKIGSTEMIEHPFNELSPDIRKYLEYKEGAADYAKGVTVDACPYDRGIRRTSWMSGWYDTRTRTRLSHIFDRWNVKYPY